VQVDLWGDIVTSSPAFSKRCARHRAGLVQTDVAALRRDVDYEIGLPRSQGKPATQATFA
jgi:hypothetical protein